jgi:hypothetical protein
VPDFGTTITIRHLIHHTSGLRCKWEWMELAGWRRDDVFTRQQVLKMIRHQKGLNFPPGTEHLYSNVGYFLLAEVVERVTGQSLRHYSDACIFRPLGMSHTHVHDDHEMLVKNMAYSYSPDPAGGFRKCVLSTAYAGSSSLYTTATDLARWLLNLDDGRVGGPAVLSQIQERGVLDGGKQISYAWGLYVGERDGLRMIYHSGGTAGYRSHLVWFPEQRLGIAVLSNLSTFLAERLALQVADACLGTRFVQDLRTIDPDPGAYAAYVGAYLLPNGLLVRVEEKDGHLVSRMLGYSELELAPVSGDRFVVASLPDVEGSFTRDAAGRVKQLTIHQQGVDIPCRKIDLPTLAQDRLTEYAGIYTSEELATSYAFVVQQGQLVAQHRRHEDTQLTCTGEDRFAGFERGFGLVLFTRDAGGRVSGFSVSGERVRHVRFDRQAELYARRSYDRQHDA